MRIMDEHYLEHPTEGVIIMKDLLFTPGFLVNHKRVRGLLRLMGLMAIYAKRNLSKLGLKKYIHPYLLKGLKIIRPNQVWAIDISYIPMKTGFLYLTAIIDIYSRYLVGWGISIYSPRVVLSYSKILIEVNSSLNYLSQGDQSKMDK